VEAAKVDHIEVEDRIIITRGRREGQEEGK
jgi:hypothetical protein